jgi:hypothetical protein
MCRNRTNSLEPCTDRLGTPCTQVLFGYRAVCTWYPWHNCTPGTTSSCQRTRIFPLRTGCMCSRGWLGSACPVGTTTAAARTDSRRPSCGTQVGTERNSARSGQEGATAGLDRTRTMCTRWRHDVRQTNRADTARIVARRRRRKCTFRGRTRMESTRSPKVPWKSTHSDRPCTWAPLALRVASLSRTGT